MRSLESEWKRRRVGISWLGRVIALVIVIAMPLVSVWNARADDAAFFADTTIAAIPKATDLAFLPDGRLLVSSQTGQIRLINEAKISTILDLSLATCSNLDRGLLGLAIDPNFTTNRFIYVFYVYNKYANDCPTNSSRSPVDRVSRFTLADGTFAAVPGSESVLIDNVPNPSGARNGGGVAFGRDGDLYVSFGDGGCQLGSAGQTCGSENSNARSRSTLLGKIIRIEPNGAVPSDNPYHGDGTENCKSGPAASGLVCQQIYAWGLGNPVRFAFDPNSNIQLFYINEQGDNRVEEVDEGIRGADYGWNCREGDLDNPDATDGCNGRYQMPIYTYNHDGCGAISGAAFVPDGIWSADFDNAYLYADSACGTIFMLKSGNLSTLTAHAPLVTALTFGPYAGTQALYFTSTANGGEVHRLTLNGDSTG